MIRFQIILCINISFSLLEGLDCMLLELERQFDGKFEWFIIVFDRKCNHPVPYKISSGKN